MAIRLLLHFEFSTRAYFSCESLIKVLKKHIPDYKKSESYLAKKELYFFLKNKLRTALDNSIHIEKSKVDTKCNMHKIIHLLNNQ